MQCTSPFIMTIEGQDRSLPCGHCRSCRMARSREWYTRLFHESLYYEKSCFVTLTYDEEQLPKDMNINKTELSAYIKRLRNHYPQGLKYYACGEYGDINQRPHYHLILFGINREGHKMRRHFVEKGPLGDSWNKGLVHIGTVTHDSMRYVTDYIHKKLYDEEAIKDAREQPFSLMSKGLGKRFALEHKDYFVAKLGCTVKGIEVGIPRYYVKLLDLKESFLWQENQKKYKDHADFIRSKKQRDATLKAKDKLYRRVL